MRRYSFKIYKTLQKGFPVTKLRPRKKQTLYFRAKVKKRASPLSVDAEDNRYDL